MGSKGVETNRHRGGENCLLSLQLVVNIVWVAATELPVSQSLFPWGSVLRIDRTLVCELIHKIASLQIIMSFYFKYITSLAPLS